MQGHTLTLRPSVPALQDVELQETCLHTCFGLKSVNVQTAGASGEALMQTDDTLRHSVQALSCRPRC